MSQNASLAASSATALIFSPSKLAQKSDKASFFKQKVAKHRVKHSEIYSDNWIINCGLHMRQQKKNSITANHNLPLLWIKMWWKCSKWVFKHTNTHHFKHVNFTLSFHQTPEGRLAGVGGNKSRTAESLYDATNTHTHTAGTTDSCKKAPFPLCSLFTVQESGCFQLIEGSRGGGGRRGGRRRRRRRQRRRASKAAIHHGTSPRPQASSAAPLWSGHLAV